MSSVVPALVQQGGRKDEASLRVDCRPRRGFYPSGLNAEPVLLVIALRWGLDSPPVLTQGCHETFLPLAEDVKGS